MLWVTCVHFLSGTAVTGAVYCSRIRKNHNRTDSCSLFKKQTTKYILTGVTWSQQITEKDSAERVLSSPSFDIPEAQLVVQWINKWPTHARKGKWFCVRGLLPLPAGPASSGLHKKWFRVVVLRGGVGGKLPTRGHLECLERVWRRGYYWLQDPTMHRLVPYSKDLSRPKWQWCHCWEAPTDRKSVV